MSLTDAQRSAIAQLSAITASTSAADRERDERLLRENGWNVQATVEQIFTGGAESASTPASVPAPAQRRNGPTAARRSSGPRSPATRGTGGLGTGGAGIGVLDIIFAPFKLVIGIISGLWYFLVRNFIPLSLLRYVPRMLLPPTNAASARRVRPAADPTSTALSLIRDLETLTGGSAQQGTLVELYIGSYRDFLNTAKRDGKIGMVVLVCGEHEDDAAFKREVLADPELFRVLREKDVLVWAGDIRSREGYQVAGTLLATTYPSIYFFSLLPGHAGAAPKLSIISTLAGSPATSTNTGIIIQTLTNTVLPRTSAFLARLRRERHTLEEARHLREEQDRAFRDAETRDREKARAAQARADEERAEAQRLVRAAEEREAEVAKRAVWRRYARKHLLPRTPPAAGAVRVALRTPLNANRNIRSFAPSASTEELFIYAETLLIPEDCSPESDPDTVPEGYTPPHDFRIVTSYPRKELRRVVEGGEGEWETVRQAGGALFAEKMAGSGWGDATEAGAESDDEEVLSE